MPQNFEKTKMQFGFTFSVKVLPKKKTGTRAAGYRLEFKLLPLNIVRKNLKKQLKTCCCDPFVPWLERGGTASGNREAAKLGIRTCRGTCKWNFHRQFGACKNFTFDLCTRSMGSCQNTFPSATPTSSIHGNRATLRLHGNEVATNDIATYLHRQPLWALTTASTRRR